MNSIERVLLQTHRNSFAKIALVQGGKTVYELKGSGTGRTQSTEIYFEEKKLGTLQGEGDPSIFQELAKNIAPILHLADSPELLERNINILSWLEEVRLMAPEVCHWTGIYWKENFLRKTDSTDLLLGPYIGESTEHLRIALNSGFCGLALSEERVVNVADVRADSRHIACSLKTRSEIVIPLSTISGDLIAELDIDSNLLSAFTPELEQRLREKALSFKYLI